VILLSEDEDYEECDMSCCEDDITHFLHNLGFFHKTLLEKAPNLNLSTDQILDVFNLWLNANTEDEIQVMKVTSNPFQELLKQMFSPDPDAHMSDGHPFSFRLYDDEDEDDSV
tara:strand:- start:317 stop:655 length:339 start_codon:yes stop_codon:yes gene_type:complete